MASYILKRKLFTTDIQAAENELKQAEALLARTPQTSSRYQTLKSNVEARRSSLQRMTQTAGMTPNAVYTRPAPAPSPAPTTTAPPPPKPPTGSTTGAAGKVNWGKVGKGALIGGAVIGAGYLAAKQIKKNKAQQPQQERAYSFRKKCPK